MQPDGASALTVSRSSISPVVIGCQRSIRFDITLQPADRSPMESV